MLSFVLFSCSKESATNLEQSSSSLSMRANYSNSEKLPNTLGVYALSDKQYIYKNAPFGLNAGLYTSEEPIEIGNDVAEATVYAYSPYSEISIDVLTEKLNFEICADQSVPENFEKSDFLLVSKKCSNFDSPLDMEFKHLLSQLEIRLVVESGSMTAQQIAKSVVEAKLTNQPTSVDVDMTNGEVENISQNMELKMYVNLNAEADNVYGIYCNLLPSKFNAGQNIGSLRIGGKQYNIVLPAAINIDKGQRTVLTLSINDQSASVVSDFTLNNWANADDVDYDMDIDTGEKMSVNDIEGNSYSIVKFGANYWMTQNLRTTKYNDATPIDFIANSDLWQTVTAGAFCTYNNADQSASKNHFLYNYFAVETQKLCPAGWSVPSLVQWYELADYFEGASLAGKALKSVTGWEANPNGGSGNGTNASQMNITPEGAMENWAKFYGRNAYLWTSTPHQTTANYCHAVYLSYNNDQLKNWAFGANKIRGYSVRCIKPVN